MSGQSSTDIFPSYLWNIRHPNHQILHTSTYVYTTAWVGSSL